MPTALPAAETSEIAERAAPPRAQLFLEGRGYVRARLVADVIALLGAVASAVAGAAAAGVPRTWFVWLFPPLVVVLLALRGMYRQRLYVPLLDGAAHIIGATSAAAMLLIATGELVDPDSSEVELFARAWLFGTFYLSGGRLALALTQRSARRTGAIGRRALIIGAGRIGALVERRLINQTDLGLVPIGYLDFDPPDAEFVPERTLPVLGAPEDLARIAIAERAEHVVLAFPSARGSDKRLIPLVRWCEQLGLGVSVVPRLFETVNLRMEVEHIGGMPLLALRSVDPKGWQFAIKHTLDRVAAGLGLLLLSPLLLALALIVKGTSPGPVFYGQRRIGRDGRDFNMLKFRSMRPPEPGEAAAARPVLGPDTAPGGVEGVDRRTAIGKVMRKLSLDELPQLWNVLMGDMSLVGPRPERPEFVAEFGERLERYKDRHRVKSGITGWAQVSGLRGKTSLLDRIEWDNYYIENWSLWLDLKILLLTVGAIFKGAE